MDPGWGFPQKIEAEILRCCGCDLFTFRLVTHPFEFQDEADRPDEALFPPRTDKRRSRKFFIMPVEVRSIYLETVAAHEHELYILSTVGLRSLIEAIVEDRIAATNYGKTLESKINALGDLVDASVLRVLHTFRQLGNSAVHAQAATNAGDLHRAFYVVEGLMEYFYGLKQSADNFEAGRKKPRRRATPKGPAK